MFQLLVTAEKTKNTLVQAPRLNDGRKKQKTPYLKKNSKNVFFYLCQNLRAHKKISFMGKTEIGEKQWAKEKRERKREKKSKSQC